jgi:aerobic C4-dicarboxylate transport protein
MASLPSVQTELINDASASSKPPFYRVLWVQVLFAMVLAIVLGYVDPVRAVAMKPLGDAFIRLITMIITLIIFCTVVTGIAGMESLKKVGRIGGMALLYFEVVSTVALLIGLLVGNVVKPGSGFNVNVATLDAKSVADYAGQAKTQSVTEFLMHIIPTTVVDAFAKEISSKWFLLLCCLALRCQAWVREPNRWSTWSIPLPRLYSKSRDC